MNKILSTTPSGLLFTLAFAGTAFAADPQINLSESALERYKELLNNQEKIQIESIFLADKVCKEDPDNCSATLKEIAFHVQGFFQESFDSDHFECLSPFRYSIREIDCGADGTPDLDIEFRGACTYDTSENEDSGIHVLITRNEQGKFVTGFVGEFWERNTIEIKDTFYNIFGSCGADCFQSSVGYFDKSCDDKKILFIDKSDHNGIHFDTAYGDVQIIQIVINNKYYYRFFGLTSDKQDTQMVLALRKFNNMLPKALRLEMECFTNLITAEEELKMVNAAKDAIKKQ